MSRRSFLRFLSACAVCCVGGTGVGPVAAARERVQPRRRLADGREQGADCRLRRGGLGRSLVLRRAVGGNDRAAPEGVAPRPRLTSEALLKGAPAVEIEHAGQRYLLRVTRENKLILTK